MSESIEELEQFKEITEELVTTFTELKTIVDSISFSKITTEMISFNDIIKQVKFTLDTMSSFTILTQFKFGEDLSKKIKKQINDIKLPNLAPQDWYLNMRLRDETNFMNFKTKFTELATVNGRIQIDGDSSVNKLLGLLDNVHTKSFKMFDAMNAGIGGVIPAFQMLTASASQFLTAMLTSPVTWMILGIAFAVMVVIEAFKRLSTSSNEDIQFLMQGIQAVGGFIMNLGKIIFEFFVASVMRIVSIVAAIVGFFRRLGEYDFMENIKITFRNFIGSIAESFSWLIKLVDKVFNTNYAEKLGIDEAIAAAEVKPVELEGGTQLIATSIVGTTDLGSIDISEVDTSQLLNDTSVELPEMTGFDGEIGSFESPENLVGDYGIQSNEVMSFNETKESTVENLTINAKSVTFVSEKESLETETSETNATNVNTSKEVVGAESKAGLVNSDLYKIATLIQTKQPILNFNFTGDVRVKEDLELISDHIVGVLYNQFINGPNNKQPFMGPTKLYSPTLSYE